MSQIDNHHTADKQKNAQHVDLRDVFTAMCRARALRFSRGEITGQEAVDRLYDWAFTRGLIDRIGDDAVQAIMGEAFRPYREG